MARKDWTDDDKRLLRRWYPHLPTADVAHILRRSLSATYGKWADTCYWLSALAITATVTFGYRH